MTDQRPWAVYTLEDQTGVRYVGVTRDPAERITRHMRDCRYKHTKRNAWLMSLTRKGERPIMVVREWTDDWHTAERRTIAHYREAGARLVNGTDGGLDRPETHGRTRRPALHRLRCKAGFSRKYVEANGRPDIALSLRFGLMLLERLEKKGLGDRIEQLIVERGLA